MTLEPAARAISPPARPVIWGVALAALAGVTLGLSLWATLSPVLPGDVASARWLQAHPFPFAHELARGVNALGYAPGTLLLSATLAGLLAWRGFPRFAVAVLLTLPLRLLPSAIKTIVDSPRPTPDLIEVLESPSSPGFPSGHAFGAALFFGLFWWLVPMLARSRLACRALRALALCLILATGYSRVLVGAHWPSDVIGGYLWGLLVLLPLLQAASRWAKAAGREPGTEGANGRAH
ncbi:hypothetical protein HRbin26_00359 [bacterium HR26]|nr:hypothetical protein HRbin26_00359 [bacterium HR26]